MQTLAKYPRNKPMIVAGVSFYALFILLIVLKSRLPDAAGGWSDPPIYDYILLLGFGICISVLCIGYTYYAWTLDAEDFSEWIKCQTFMRKKQAQKPVGDFARAYTHWAFRFITPTVALLGIVMIGFMVLAITRYLLK